MLPVVIEGLSIDLGYSDVKKGWADMPVDSYFHVSLIGPTVPPIGSTVCSGVLAPPPLHLPSRLIWETSWGLSKDYPNLEKTILALQHYMLKCVHLKCVLLHVTKPLSV